MKITDLMEAPPLNYDGLKKFKITYTRGGGKITSSRVVYSQSRERAIEHVNKHLGHVIEVEELVNESTKADRVLTADGLVEFTHVSSNVIELVGSKQRFQV